GSANGWSACARTIESLSLKVCLVAEFARIPRRPSEFWRIPLPSRQTLRRGDPPMRESVLLTGEFPAESEEVLQRFQEAWEGPEQPDLESYRPTLQPGNTRLLFELVHVDLDFRLRRGEAARVEQYLERYPWLGQDRAALLELIVAEYTLRRCWQGQGDLEEY